MREMRIHETLEHPNVLKLFGGEYRERDGIWGSGLYIVLDLGESRVRGGGGAGADEWRSGGRRPL